MAGRGLLEGPLRGARRDRRAEGARLKRRRPRSASTALPAPLDSFVGRDEELARIASSFASGAARLVTITGPGGMGKTRVALEAARRADDVVFADVSEATTREELLAALAASLGVSGANVTAESLASRLGATLLVVDNFEQLLGAADGASTIATLLARAPALRVLVTSRERLRIAGEHVIELHPLEGEGERLFVERARAASSTFIAEPPELVAEIVRALDGIPLAIELCASRVGILGLAQLIDELRASTLAVIGSPLRRAIEGSWRLLDPEAKTTLSRASVFHGSFDLAAAEAVLELPDRSRALERMQLLHDRSLVRAESGRFRLYEPVREIAAEHLVDRERVVALHAAHYLARGAALAGAADGPAARRAREELALEVPNLLAIARDAAARPREALAALLALEPVLSERGPLDLYAALLDRAIAGASEDAGARVRGLLARARLDVTRGRFVDAFRLFEEARATEDRAMHALATSKSAVIGAFLGHADDAVRARFDEALALAAEIDDARLLGIVLSDRASASARAGDEAAALADRERTVECFTRANDAHRRAVTLGYLGSSCLATGRFVEAERFCSQAVDELRAQGDVRTEGQVLGFLARARHARGRFADARASLRAALARIRSAGDRWFEGVYEGWLADVLLEDDSAAEALEGYERAIALLDAAGERPYAALFRAASLVARASLDASMPSEPALPAALPPSFAAGVRLHEAHARLLRGAITPEEARPALDAATFPSDDVRFAARLLRAHLDRPPRLTCDSVVMGPEARWFERANGPRVTLERHRAIRLLLQRLVEARLATPGAAVSRADLVAAGWPGERIHPEAAVNRLNVSLTRLKRLGLRDVLRTRDDGVLVDPAVTVTCKKD